MGLDMYVYKVKKPTGLKKNVTYNYDDLRNLEYSMFEADDVENELWFADLLPFCVKVRCTAQYYDTQRIAQSFNLGANTMWCGFGPKGFYFRGDNGEITIPDENIEEYCIAKEKDWYVTSMKEVAYWRKHYELQDALYSIYATKGIEIENCGYYALKPDVLDVINTLSKKKFGLGRYKTETLMYHEWY